MKPSTSFFLRLALAGAAVFLAFAPALAEAQRPIPVNIESTPPGATVYLDSTTGAPLGTTPMRNVRIPRGSHTLIFQLENYAEARITIEVRRRRETFRTVLTAMGTIEISAGNASARGATVFVDGAPVPGSLGDTALRVPMLTPGRHQVRVEREGYVTFEQWVDVAGGQTVRITPMLEAVAPETGSILIDVDVRGAAIYLDGVDTGRVTNTILDNVTVGTHDLEIRAEGIEPFHQTVLVARGARVEIHETLTPVVVAPTVGRLTVVVSPAAASGIATVMIDGVALPEGTRSRSDLEPGTHIVQVTAPGYDEITQSVTVVAGEAATASITMSATRREPTDINLQASVAGATIIIDGEEHRAPYVADETGDGGTHSVVVRAAGYEDVSFTCSTLPDAGDDADCQRLVELGARGTRVRVVSRDTLPDEVIAHVYIDDAEVGTAPYVGRVTPGPHTFRLEATGYEGRDNTLEVEFSEETRTVEVVLVNIDARRLAAATTHSAAPLPPGHPAIDLSGGWPYLAEARLLIGIHEFVDVGFAFRTFGRLNEFEGRIRSGFRFADDFLAVGGEVRFGGGIGPDQGAARPVFDAAVPIDRHQDFIPNLDTTMTYAGYPTNSAFFTLQANFSVLFQPVAAATFWGALDITSDEWVGSARRVDAYADLGPGGMGDTICSPTTPTSGFLHCRRQDMARFRVGGAIEFNIDSWLTIWGIFEGIAAQPADSRRILGAVIFDVADIRIYPRLGMTFKF